MKPTCICEADGCCLLRMSGDSYCTDHEVLIKAA